MIAMGRSAVPRSLAFPHKRETALSQRNSRVAQPLEVHLAVRRALHAVPGCSALVVPGPYLNTGGPPAGAAITRAGKYDRQAFFF